MIQPYQQRMIDELKELQERLTKLLVFLGDEVFTKLPTKEKALLVAQATTMRRYAGILDRRIKQFRARRANDQQFKEGE